MSAINWRMVIIALGVFSLSGVVTFLLLADGGRSFIVEEAHAAVRTILRDAASAKFDNEVIIGASGSRVVCGDVNAKNGFGGYVGNSAFIYHEQSKSVRIARESEDARSIDIDCTKARLEELKAELARLKAVQK